MKVINRGICRGISYLVRRVIGHAEYLGVLDNERTWRCPRCECFTYDRDECERCEWLSLGRRLLVWLRKLQR